MVQQIAWSVYLVLGLAANVNAQQSIADNYLQTYVDGCRTIQMVLDSRAQHQQPDDNYTVAGQECHQLQAAVSASDEATVQSAITVLRPILARLGLPPTTPQEQLAALEKATAGSTGLDVEYALPDLAKRAFDAGDSAKAGNYAQQLLKMAPDYRNDWNYGNAIFFGNFILGRIALQEGNITRAGQYLLASAATHGSPQLDSFGPNMSLADDLLRKGQNQVVLQYFEACKKFWNDDHGKLDQWTTTARSGGTPDFGANLHY